MDSYGRFHAWLTRAHVPDFLELNLTLAQLRTLYLVTASGPMSMSQVAERLGTAPSTATAGLNEDSIIAAELGTVVIGGLLSSTFLTLIVVPAAYWLVERLRARLGGRPA